MKKTARTDLMFKALVNEFIKPSAANTKYVIAKDINNIELNVVIDIMDESKDPCAYRILANNEYHTVTKEDFTKFILFFEDILHIKPIISKSYRFMADNEKVTLRSDEEFILIERYNLYSRDFRHGIIQYFLERTNPKGLKKSYEVKYEVYKKLNEIFK